MTQLKMSGAMAQPCFTPVYMANSILTGKKRQQLPFTTLYKCDKLSFLGWAASWNKYITSNLAVIVVADLTVET